MYRIKKVLNHNTVIAIRQDDNQECLIMGKGIGFGKKTSERIDTRPEDRVYSMKEYRARVCERDHQVSATGVPGDYERSLE